MKSSACLLATSLSAFLVVPLAYADYPAVCSVNPSGSNTLGKAGATCCSSATFKCDSSTVSPAITAGRKNILLLIADDQSYCEYGFMLGTCATGGTQCRSNLDCAPTDECVGRTSGLSAAAPLRMNDMTCRYRQRPSRASQLACANHPDPFSAAIAWRDGDNRAWPYHSSNYPCANTNPNGAISNPPVALTPHLDQLATFGTVFPRAYVGGNACKASRAVIHYGKPHRHLLELTPADAGKYSMASWLLDNDHDLDNVPAGLQIPETMPPAVPRYWPFVLGKSEILDESEGGYQSGIAKSKPHLTKYACPMVDPADCAEAAEDAVGSPNALRVPWGVREDVKGVVDLMDVIAGRGRPEFRANDKNVVVRNHPTGSETNDSVCDPCHDNPGASVCGECTSQLQTPFFVWFAPNQPHKRGDGRDFRSIYGDAPDEKVGGKWVKHEARVTQFDQGVGTAIDELKRHCVCGLGGTKQSLWDHTVVIFLSDHGFMMPEAKKTPTENTHRTPIIVSTPEHRAGTIPGRQYPNELAHAIDVFRTVLAYAGVPFSGDPVEPDDPNDYPFSHDLAPWAAEPPASGHIRDVVYGEDAGRLKDNVDRGPNRRRYLVTRPGLLGLCINDATGFAAETGAIAYPGTTLTRTHAKPCFLEGANDCPTGTTCQAAKRCVNDPHKACTANADCVEVTTFCSSGGKCVYDPLGSLGDMARPVTTSATLPSGVYPSRSCTVTGTTDEEKRQAIASQCVPTGVDLCRGVMLKVEMKGDGSLNGGVTDRAWDVLWDPDQRRNLLGSVGGDPTYLGATGNGDSGAACSANPDSLRCKIENCLSYYWSVDSELEWDDTVGNCPWEQ